MKFPSQLLSNLLRVQNARVFLVAQTSTTVTFVELKPGEKVMAAAVTVNVGHEVDMSIVYLDQNGNPMLQAPVPDAAPAWSNSTAATGTLTAAADGMTAVEKAVAVGSDVVTLSLSVGGKAFSATLPITVAAAPQVLTSIDIVPAIV